MSYPERLQKGTDEMSRKRREYAEKLLRENPGITQYEFERKHVLWFDPFPPAP